MRQVFKHVLMVYLLHTTRDVSSQDIRVKVVVTMLIHDPTS